MHVQRKIKLAHAVEFGIFTCAVRDLTLIATSKLWGGVGGVCGP
jgi:hypothetical protein